MAFVFNVGTAISSIAIFLVIYCLGTHCLEPVEVKLYPRCAPGQTMPLFLEIGSPGTPGNHIRAVDDISRCLTINR
jgi:hypothetical protein